MSVLIKGIKMPKNCGECFVGDRTICHDRCPLVEVYTHHGRLIDADAFKEENERLLHCDFPYLSETTLEELIDEAPTVIEAEEE